MLWQVRVGRAFRDALVHNLQTVLPGALEMRLWEFWEICGGVPQAAAANVCVHV